MAQHKHDGYWVDVGTPQAYWTAHMHILEGNGVRLDDDEWPIWSAQPQLRPAKVTKEASIDADGLVAYRAAFDYAAELPAFIRDQN